MRLLTQPYLLLIVYYYNLHSNRSLPIEVCRLFTSASQTLALSKQHMTHKEKWLIFAPVGLIAIGAGASMVDWAGSLKTQGKPTKTWVLAGTAALIVLNAGVSLFGQSVVESVLHEVREKPAGS